MRSRILALLCCAVIALCALLAKGAPTAAAQAAAASGATLSGSVVNGTHGNAPVSGTQVVLQTYVSHASAQDSATVTTDAQGHFTFAGLDGSGATTYAVYTRFQGGTFASGAITFANGTVAPQTLTVYDATASDANVRVALTTLLLGAPDQRTGLIPVGEFVTFDNTGHTAYVPAVAPSGGQPMGLLRFWLPAGAKNLSVGAGFEGAQILQVNTGFATSATVPPGKSQFAFVFDLPYSSTQYLLDYKTEYPTAQVAVLAPVGTHTAGGDFVAQPSVTALGQQYDLYTHDNVAGSVHLHLQLLRLPMPGERPDLDFTQLLALGGALALLLALLLALYVRRGDLAQALGLTPGSAVALAAASPPQSGGSVQEREAERKRLLKALLALENAHAAGSISTADYEARAGRTRATLRGLLAAELPAQADAPTIPTSAQSNEAASPDAPAPAPAAAQPAEPGSTKGGGR
jgi:hypothetical protein